MSGNAPELIDAAPAGGHELLELLAEERALHRIRRARAGSRRQSCHLAREGCLRVGEPRPVAACHRRLQVASARLRLLALALSPIPLGGGMSRRRRHRCHRRCRCRRRRCKRLRRCRRYLGWPSSSVGQAPDRLHGHEGTSGAGLLQLADEGRQPRLAPRSRPGDAIDLLEERARLDREFARAKPAQGVHVVLQRRGSGGARGAGWKGERGARLTGAKSSAPRRRLECVRGEAGRSVPVPAQLPHLLDKLDRLLVYAHDRPESILAILVVHACCPEDRLVPAVHGRRRENHGGARHIADQVSAVHRRGGCT